VTAKVIHGDCLDAMRAMEPNSVDAIVCDPPYGLRGALNRGVCLPVAGLTECDEVGEPVGFPVVREHPKGDDVVNVVAGLAAMLADATVAGAGLAPLGLPVRASAGVRSPEVLRVQLAAPVSIPTEPGAKLTLAGRIANVARGAQKLCTAPEARHLDLAPESLGDSGVLALRGTGLPAPVLRPRWLHPEGIAAGLAGDLYRRSHRGNLRQGVGQ
jgi:hypothetical protein